ncbi:succinylglutamate desuccinylase/aspartoacylase family protein [Thiothrix litoralis]|uniref:Succinylglutamate desuccinylase/aspartoacylase family protein n=1 Tax=Thiothrix litoralis TaxID=2891210 RepID=A0ABX7WQA7_9GAMM|nr:M14 family metallopeptidase [Thiothrix litoralis]QTR45152.1 succinylglutamate desuccinylase/aspartoacylase family protein [Thiothrix litoralis]
MLKLTELTTLPAGFFALQSPRELHTLMPNPTLLHLEGRREPRLFVSVLLHGNEDTGFFAIQQLLRKYQEQPLPRGLSVFFGNIDAAKAGMRRLDGQPDYNRVWPGEEVADCAESRLMAQVTDIMASRSLFASIDVHNNTGKNPHYGCINVLDNRALQLARLFSNIVVFFETPRGVQSMAMAKYCPAVTVECGKPGVAHGVEHVLEFLDAALHLQEIPDHPLPAHDVNIYQTVAQVTVPAEYRFSFSDISADILLLPALDRYNFSELPAGTAFATSDHPDANLQAWDDEGMAVSEHFFFRYEDEIRLKQPLMPAMLTLDETVIRQDCLCYLMKRLLLEGQQP